MLNYTKKSSSKLLQTNLDFLNSGFLVVYFFLTYKLNLVGKEVAFITLGSGNISPLAYFFNIFSCSISCSSNNSFIQVDKNSEYEKGVIMGGCTGIKPL